jgi:hypothetical protein
MKRTGLLFTLVLFLSSCSALDLLPVPNAGTPASSLTSAYTSTNTSTLTATLPPPTITSTPTLTGLKPRTPVTSTVTPTNTATSFVIWLPGGSPFVPTTPYTMGGGFETVNISGNAILWGSCKPGSITVSARVSEPEDVESVVFFVHLQNIKNEDTTPWSKGAAMDHQGSGIFTYELKANTVSGRNNYLKAWVVYQLVATDKDGKVVGRTPIFMGGLTIGPCM